jgi:hypothetical protein
MSVSILAVDDEVDVADMFRQHFSREVRQGQYASRCCVGSRRAGQICRSSW